MPSQIKKISVDQYVEAVKNSLQAPMQDKWLEIVIAGLIGEFGSVSTIFKKHILNQETPQLSPHSKDRLLEELGDFLWYLVALTLHENISLKEDVLFEGLQKIPTFFNNNEGEDIRIKLVNLKKYSKKQYVEALKEKSSQFSNCFNQYQEIAQISQLTDDTIQMTKVCLSEINYLVSLLCLHTLDENDQKLIFGTRPKEVKLCIQDVLWNVAIIAGIQKIKLEDVAHKNSQKIADIFPSDKTPTALTYNEEKFPVHERFPTEFTIDILDVGLDSIRKHKSRMYWEGRPLGDDLTDNAHDPDGYRFHDILHLAFIAKLGWSPVVRAMMDRKRKSDTDVDEVEDGARARITEELVAKLMHGEAVSLQEARSEVKKDSSLFPKGESFSSDFYRSIKRLVNDLEVKDCKHWEWEEAAHEAFAIYNLLCEAKEGSIKVNRTSRKLSFSPEVIFDLHGVNINQTIDIRGASVQNGRDALLKVACEVIDPLNTFAEGDFQFHPTSTNTHIVQTRGQARDIARQKKILTIKISQSFNDQSVVTFASALGDPKDFQ